MSRAHVAVGSRACVRDFSVYSYVCPLRCTLLVRAGLVRCPLRYTLLVRLPVSLHATRTYRSFAAFGLFFRFHFARPTLFRQRPVASWYSSTDVKSVGGWLSAVLLAAVVAALEPRVRGEVDDFEEERFLFFFPFPLFQRGIGLSVSGAAALPVSLALPVDINARGCNKCQCSGGWWCIPSAGFK